MYVESPFNASATLYNPLCMCAISLLHVIHSSENLDYFYEISPKSHKYCNQPGVDAGATKSKNPL